MGKKTSTTSSTASTASTASAKSEKKEKKEKKTTKEDKLTVKKTACKKERDPNAPKRGLSPYFHFSGERRPQLKKDNPETAFGDLTKMVAAEWNSMSDEQKASYVEKAAKDKVRYEAEKQEYEAKTKQSAQPTETAQ